MPETVIQVDPTRLRKAGEVLLRRAQQVGQDGLLAVCVELGLDPYLEYDGDRFHLKALTDLQVVALSAAMLAYLENGHGISDEVVWE